MSEKQLLTTADRLRIAMAYENTTVAELARDSHISATSLYAWASGRHEPSLSNIDRLATELPVSAEWLFNGQNPPAWWGAR